MQNVVNSHFNFARYQGTALVANVNLEVATLVVDSDVVGVQVVNQSVCNKEGKGSP